MSFSFFTFAQTKPVKIVFDVTSSDTLVHQAALRHVTEMAKAYPQSSFEVVVYGGAMLMFVKGKSTVSKSIQKLEGNSNVSFAVCEQTMVRYKIDKSQLLTNVRTVPDGILEIVNKQAEGWGYIKEAH
jgi:intracellular sulfur oxidation DsrE/DsrF family protein